MIKRIRTSKLKKCGNYRNSVSNNYYPICDTIFIRDHNTGMQLTVLTDRAQGGSSVSDGQLELMIHRRLVAGKGTDILDERGVDGRGLIVRGKHYLIFKPINESTQILRELNKRLFMSPLMTFSPMIESLEVYRNKYRTSYSGLNQELPQNLHLLTLEKWEQNEILIRFEHFYEIADKTELSKPIEVDLQYLFSGLRIRDIREMTLSANQLLSQSHRLNWNSMSDSNNVQNISNHKNIFKIQLNAQQIRTFILTIEYQYNSDIESSQ